MIDRKIFFNIVRKAPFPGSLTPDQVAGCEAILSEWERRKLTDLRWLAYMLATPYLETAHTMQPIHELGPRSYFDKYETGTSKGRALGNTEAGDGFRFRGRGYVQLTGRDNYKKMSAIVGADLIGNPDLALTPSIAAAIMFEGMMRGTFTGKKLADFFTPTLSDYTNARKIINGTDRAETIAGYARLFYGALNAASQPAAQPIPDVPKPVPGPVPKPSNVGGVVGGAVVLGGTTVIANQSQKNDASTGQIALVVGCGLAIAIAVFFVIRAWRAK